MQNLMRAFMAVLQKSMQKLILEGSLSLLQWYPWYPWPWHLHYITKISLKSSQSDTCDLNRELVNLLTHGQFIISKQLHDNSINKSNNNSHCAVTKRLHSYDDMYDQLIMCSVISTLLHLSEKVCRSILLPARLSTCWPRQYNLIPVFYYPSLHQGSLKVLKIELFIIY